jgi:glycosyltransferase involved in cell wall biosynthesis
MGNPFFFFNAGNTLFIFMDTTGYSNESLQMQWITELLENADEPSRRIVFTNRSLPDKNYKELISEKKYMMSEMFRKDLLALFSRTKVLAVVSGSTGVSDRKTIEGTRYISTGGGGGIVETSTTNGKPFYYTQITVDGDTVSTEDSILPDTGTTAETSILLWIWNKLYSWIYISFLNILLIISISFAIVYTLYNWLVLRINYYPDLNAATPKGYKLTIAMFTNNYLPFVGGVPVSIVRLKEGLERLGHTVYIFAPAYENSPAEEDEHVIRFKPLFHYRKDGLIVPVSNIFSARIKKEFRKINPDIVHVHHPFWLGSSGRRLARIFRKPVVFTYHTRIEQYNHYVPIFHNLAGGQIPHLIIKHFASSCDAVIAPTTSAKRYLRNLGIGKLIIVQPTGVDPDPTINLQISLPAPKGKILFSVFRLSNEKNPYFLIDGIAELDKQTKQPFTCYIAGSGPEEASMKQYIAEKKLEGRIVLLGSVKPADIASYYKLADLFIFSSLSETQGMVILEAMAGGLPVVAVNSSGITDVVQNGVNGFKTEADITDWVNKIRTILEDDSLRLKMSRNARSYAEKYSMDAMSRNILDMYYEIIEWKKKHPEQVFIR